MGIRQSEVGACYSLVGICRRWVCRFLERHSLLECGCTAVDMNVPAILNSGCVPLSREFVVFTSKQWWVHATKSICYRLAHWWYNV